MLSQHFVPLGSPAHRPTPKQASGKASPWLALTDPRLPVSNTKGMSSRILVSTVQANRSPQQRCWRASHQAQKGARCLAWRSEGYIWHRREIPDAPNSLLYSSPGQLCTPARQKSFRPMKHNHAACGHLGTDKSRAGAQSSQGCILKPGASRQSQTEGACTRVQAPWTA